MPKEAKGSMRRHFASFHVAATITLGAAVVLWAALNWNPHDQLRTLAFIATALAASTLKVRLPGVTGTASVLALFVLIGIVNFSLPEAIAIGALSMLAQCTWRTAARPRLEQEAFSICSFATAVYLSSLAYHGTRAHLPEPLSLALLTLTFFITNSLPVAGIISLTEGKKFLKVWSDYRWLLPCYAVGASLAWLIGTFPRAVQWELPLICLPLVYLVHRSSRTHIVQVEQEKKHMVEMNGLHLRTIEALALAIDAKDHTTHDHLQRVQLYAVEIGRDLGLSEAALDALKAASMLHDIGKLAVPEHIISKPGKLSRAEFERMKIHPVVGAEILERVRFPYPVVPIVYSHHEKWDGTGYPNGLRGEEIPIGARILAAVDCLDALASDRQYRKALPLDDAMAKVASEAGTSFDPKVVEILRRRYIELEKLATEQPLQAPPKLSTDIKVERGSAPDAGFAESAEKSKVTTTADASSFLAKAQRIGQEMASVVRALGDSLRPEDIFALLAIRLKEVVPFDSLAVYGLQENTLTPQFVNGENFRLFSSLRIPLGEGLSGWVAQNHKAILNGNPSVEPGYLNDPTKYSTLRSALAVPVESGSRVIAVLALYRAGQDAFTADELHVLEAIGSTLGSLIQPASTPKAFTASAK